MQLYYNLPGRYRFFRSVEVIPQQGAFSPRYCTGREPSGADRPGACFLTARDTPTHPQHPQFFTRGAIFPVWVFCGWDFGRLTPC